MERKWTDEQLAVIEHRGGNLLVSAAAGSGKTAVLIERIMGRIMMKPLPSIYTSFWLLHLQGMPQEK